MRDISMPCPRRAIRRARDGVRVALMSRGRDAALTALRLALPLILLLLAAPGQVASAHPGGGQPAEQASQALSHHAGAAGGACCGDLSQGEDGKSCLAQCLASCSYCAPLPEALDFPDARANAPRPASSEPMRGAIAPPYLRPPLIS